ncbi:MAG: DUF3866 family protein [Microthrixaceae bacterium]
MTEVISSRKGLQRLAVRMPDGSAARAYALTELVGDARVGDRVVCNTTAVDLALGTGGWHFVHWNTSRDSLDLPGPDHIMKMRYTSLQADVGTSELEYPGESDRPLQGTPVVVCSVHSQVALVALGFASAMPGGRLAYVMTDGAALPLALSDLVEHLRERDLIVGSVTSGHAFGGDLEAVTVPSALGLAAHVLRADAVVVGMGPGVVGTGTSMGTTAIEAAALLDAASARGGTPVMCVRASEGDRRERHVGVSHHVVTTLALASTEPLVAPEPPEVAGLEGLRCSEPLTAPDPRELQDRFGIEVTTMGRRYEEDPVFFRAAVAAGVLAAEVAKGGPSEER